MARKILSVLLSICIIAFCFTGSVFAEKEDVNVDVGSLSPSTFTPGNVDGDEEGNVDLMDVVVLAQYVAEWEGITYVTEALDPDGSGVSDLSDVVRLAQYVAEWDVEISEAPYISK